MAKKEYGEDVAYDFCIALEKAKIILPDSHESQSVLDAVHNVINLTLEEAVKTKNAVVQIIHSEFSDWIETYKK